jgi:DNA adenine methylase
LYADAYEKHGAPFYSHVRNHLSDDMHDHELAAVFIFLNKTGFNGIWRVNADGKYNVPPGKFAKTPTICDEDRLRGCAKALSTAAIINCDFRAVAERAQPGDVVYDPPSL